MTDIEKAANIIKDLADKNPEVSKELGKTAITLTKAINVALAPIAGIVWGYEKIEDYLKNKLSEKLKNVSEDNIITPPINIAGPIIEAMRFTGENDVLRDMYANLLAASMNKMTTGMTHPRYVEIIKNLTPDEAKILKYLVDHEVKTIRVLHIVIGKDVFAYYTIEKNLIFSELIDLDYPDNLQPYLDNLSQLGIFMNNLSSIEYNKSELGLILNLFPAINKEDFSKKNKHMMVNFDTISYGFSAFGNLFKMSVI